MHTNFSMKANSRTKFNYSMKLNFRVRFDFGLNPILGSDLIYVSVYIFITKDRLKLMTLDSDTRAT